jgi:hypothetical protein
MHKIRARKHYVVIQQTLTLCFSFEAKNRGGDKMVIAVVLTVYPRLGNRVVMKGYVSLLPDPPPCSNIVTIAAVDGTAGQAQE